MGVSWGRISVIRVERTVVECSISKKCARDGTMVLKFFGWRILGTKVLKPTVDFF